MATDLTQEFCALRDTYIEKQFGRLNDMQRQAVFTTDGPLLILAGAGSGKTTVLVNRIANLIRFGSAHGSRQTPRPATEDDVKALRNAIMTGTDAPSWLDGMLRQNAVRSWNVMAITFTNKAAGELKERLRRMLGGEEGDEVFASTFHSACVRILRRDIDKLGFSSSFTIYDTDDSLKVIKECLRELNLAADEIPEDCRLIVVFDPTSDFMVNDGISDVDEIEKLDKFLAENNIFLSDNQYDALVSLTYNIGSGWMKDSVLSTMLKSGLYSTNELASAMGIWCHVKESNGEYVINDGLVNRRMAELRVFLYADYSGSSDGFYWVRFVQTEKGDRERDIAFYEAGSVYDPPFDATSDTEIFLGWYTESGELLTDLTATENRTVYAQWESDFY